MRVLVLGAGAVGGYFGGRLLEAGRDVSFLVRAGRGDQLRKNGLVIRSPLGDAHLEATPVITGQAEGVFDLVILSCKAYDIDSAIEAIIPAVGTGTVVLPLLNGIRHLEILDRNLGSERVIGGLCAIAATLDDDGAVVHLDKIHELRFGERTGVMSARIAAIEQFMAPAAMVSQPSSTILNDLWEKWVFLSTLAGITCLMRASIGNIAAAPWGKELVLQLLDECAAIASAHGYSPREAFLERTRAMLTEADSVFTASMLRDIERGGRTEADHVLGDLIARADQTSTPAPLLRTAYCHVKAYEQRREHPLTPGPATGPTA